MSGGGHIKVMITNTYNTTGHCMMCAYYGTLFRQVENTKIFSIHWYNVIFHTLV